MRDFTSEQCRPAVLKLLLTRKNNSVAMNKDIFIDTIKMDTQTVFHNNGSINIYPCHFELGQQIVNGTLMASQKGRMTTDDEGRSKFMPYAENSGSRYTRLFTTAHGDVKASMSSVIFTLRFPKKYGRKMIEKLLREETETMKAYARVLKVED